MATFGFIYATDPFTQRLWIDVGISDISKILSYISTTKKIQSISQLLVEKRVISQFTVKFFTNFQHSLLRDWL